MLIKFWNQPFSAGIQQLRIAVANMNQFQKILVQASSCTSKCELLYLWEQVIVLLGASYCTCGMSYCTSGHHQIKWRK